uniref:C2H2-type domain-containing protein n=1 Tax=Leptobrachium leishanense TaxID=445787 RepID=A0A8C5Q4V8_9ANUR
MNKRRNQVAERILDLTLEIIYVLTGEDYEVVKKPHAHATTILKPRVSGGFSRTMSSAHPVICDRNHEKKILNLSSTIIQLLTGEELEYVEEHELMENSVETIDLDMKRRETCSEEFPPLRDGARSAQSDITPSGVKDESDSREDGILALTDISGQSGHPPTGIKVEPTTRPAGSSSDTMRCPHTESKCFKVESDLCRQEMYEDTDVDLSTDYLCIRIKEESDSCEGDLTDVDNNGQTDASKRRKSFSLSETRSDTGEVSCDAIQGGKKQFSCSECGKCFNQKWNFINHQKTHTGEKPYKCTECGKCYTQSANLATHKKRIHTGEKPFKCNECGKCFTQATLLASHEMIHTGEKPFKCPNCEKCFNQKSNLIKHQRIHTGEKPFKCGECGKCFTWATLLASHVRIHTGEKPFKCAECGKCFTQAAHLASHKLIHTGEKTFKCPECGKCFIQKSNLVKHQTIHTGEKPFKCTECGKCFNQKFNLVKHQTIHTGDRPFKCTDCGKTFSRPMQLATHKKTHIAETTHGAERGKS